MNRALPPIGPRSYNLDNLATYQQKMTWKLADAKNRFSELVRKALTEGPQRVSRRGDAVVVLSEADYQRLTGQRPGFRDYLLDHGPSFEGVDVSRDRSPAREVSL